MYCVLILCMYVFPFKLCSFIEINSEVFAAALEQNLLAAENKVCLQYSLMQNSAERQLLKVPKNVPLPHCTLF